MKYGRTKVIMRTHYNDSFTLVYLNKQFTFEHIVQRPLNIEDEKLPFCLDLLWEGLTVQLFIITYL